MLNPSPARRSKKCIAGGVFAFIAIGIGLAVAIVAILAKTGVVDVGAFANSGSSGGTQLKVDQINTASRRRSRRRLASVPSDAPNTDGYSGFAVVDGVSLSLAAIRFTPLIGGSNHLVGLDWSSSGGKKITFGPDVATVAIEDSLDLDVGVYTEADVVYYTKYDIKAFCNTSSYFLYTSASGVKTLNHNYSSSLLAMPSDYDYLSYDLVQMAKDLGLTFHSNNDPSKSYSNSLESFTIQEGVPMEVALLFDTHYVGRCYDGTGSTEAYPATPPQNGIWPFSFDSYDTAIEFTFPVNAPAFGLTENFPVFVQATVVNSTTTSTDLSVSETYLYSMYDGIYSGVDAYNNTPQGGAQWHTYVTPNLAVFNVTDGTLMAIMEQMGSVDDLGIPSNITTDAVSGNTTIIYGPWGQWKYTPDTDTYFGNLKELKIINWSRHPINEIFTTSLVPGPECGLIVQNMSGNQGGSGADYVTKNCSDPAVNVYWMRVA